MCHTAQKSFADRVKVTAYQSRWTSQQRFLTKDCLRRQEKILYNDYFFMDLFMARYIFIYPGHGIGIGTVSKYIICAAVVAVAC